MEFRSIHTVDTAEHIQIQVELAGLANRVFAFGIDLILMALLMGAVLGGSSLWAYLQASPEIAKIGISLGMFLVFFGYHLFQEWLWNGKTVGKRIFHIRVVRSNGQPIGFWESFGRNLMRLVDVYLLGVGLLCMLFNRGERRFGDFVAGTVVINDQPITKPGNVLPPLVNRLVVNETDVHGIRLTPEEVEWLNAYRARRDKLLPEPRQQLAQAVYRYFSERWHRSIETDMDLDVALERYQQSLQQS